ncbi:hypothetical protein CERSUDRAFT_122685 [Gelatoporia subvermispora B]|uniref:Uncharacterized protein n=1 Tax=Ceriporiopsis subvermispora (strain B) TaxID=914234 RepID=M2QQA7_CERS8|nr:hypothetical protein CERSUDRAFT_122685 [Gelatoporia subvermispora B]
MGLPLFSQRYQTPDVRVEPEPTPACEKWTHWNAFDPDSDEFFESEDAVYEAFIDPSQLPLRDSEDGEQSRSSSLPPVVMRYAESSSSSSSSGRGTPTDDTQTVSVEEVNLDTRQSGWVQVGRIDEGETRRDPMPTTFVESPIEDRVYQAGEMVTQYANMYQIVATPPRRPAPSQTPPHITAPPFIRSPTYIDYASRPPTPPMHIERASRPTTPVRDNGSERGAPPSSPVTPLRPATPPREEEPTPPPSVTPRIYSWGGSPWIVPSPVPASPLAHRGVPPPMTWVAPITVIPPSRVRG